MQLQNWAGASKLLDLTRWLRHRTHANSEEKAALQWRILEEGFGRAVAEAYRDGMKALWRVTEPERPKRKPGAAITIKWTTILGFAGVALEAADDPDWTARLLDHEVVRAVEHGCMTEQGCPEWVGALVSARPQVSLPVLRKALREEWSSAHGERSDVLSRFVNPAVTMPSSLQQIFYETITGREPRHVGTLNLGIRILKRLELDESQRCRAARLATKRFGRYLAVGKEDELLRYLAMSFLVDTGRSIDALASWIDGAEGAQRQARAERAFATLFERHDPLVMGAVNGASVLGLEKLVRLAYSHIRPENDVVHEGTYTPDTRDYAEDARSGILKALLERPGPDAYRAVRRLANDGIFRLRAQRFNELARDKAERDTEIPPWTVAETLLLERRHTAVVKSGADLLRLVQTVLDDIQSDLLNADASSRCLLGTALDEKAVQNWLAEQLRLRRRDRFHVYREAEVARGDLPDIVVASTAAPVEVALEVKHCGKDWTLKELDRALRHQLAEDYLKPESRRHGILILTHHGNRTWRDPNTGETIAFQELVQLLRTIASTLLENETGPIEVHVAGLDASPSDQESGRRPVVRSRRSSGGSSTNGTSRGLGS